MSSRFVVTLCLALASAASTAAQQPPPAKPAAEQPAAAPRPEPYGQPINVRVELAIADQAGPGEPLKKSVTMLVADRARGSIRNVAGSRGYVNADATPHVLPSGAIRVVIGLEYTPSVPIAGTESTRTLSQLNEQLTVMVESGKPLVISQAADPVSERKVTVHLTATVVK